MTESALQQLYRRLPSVDEVLRGERGQAWLSSYPRERVTRLVRQAISRERQRLRSASSVECEADEQALRAAVEAEVEAALRAYARPSLLPVINATGVILHTNLGRAPLPESAIEAIRETAARYSNLEYDLSAGARGKRDTHVGALLEELLGAPAIVVNNNAAAIFLVLNELAAGGEVIVSRGELIEIGDGFRIPEILERSGARLVEAGTTNRTRADDYRRAAGEHTRALLRVHPSNFRIVGFTARPALAELAALGRELGLPVIEDLGSGCLYDFSSAGFSGEPLAAGSIRAGADLVTFSGDKLLGGPQAGIIAGRPELVRRVRRNPLFRALRIDKLTSAALEATLRAYLLEQYDEVPVLRMVREPVEALRERAQRLAAQIGSGATVEAAEAVLGGGSTPAQTLPTAVVAIRPGPPLSPARLEEALRKGDPPVIARIEGERLLLDLRTVFPEQEEPLAAAVRSAYSENRGT